MTKLSIVRSGGLRRIGLMSGGEVWKEGLRMKISILADDLAYICETSTLNAYSAKSPTKRSCSPRA